MRRVAMVLVLMVSLFAGEAATGSTPSARADTYMEYYRDNLFLGLAYHRVGCLTNWTTIQSGQEYDGFTTTDYCQAGASAASVPGGSWFDYDYIAVNFADAQATANSCGTRTNNKYGTPNYAARSNTCSYNILTNCNSDCWIRYFSTCLGYRVATASTCIGYSYP